MLPGSESQRRLAGLARLAPLFGAALVVLVTTSCDTGDGKALRPPTSQQRANVPTTTTSSVPAPLPPDAAAGTASTTTMPVAAFALSVPWPNGGAIDVRATCDGANLSPLLTWTAPPTGTVELALVVTDDQAGGFVHWAVAGIPPTAGEHGEGATFTSAVEGLNGVGTTGWTGPCPPPGGPHTYRFTLYALDQQVELPDGFTGADLTAVAEPAALAVNEVTGTYTRAP